MAIDGKFIVAAGVAVAALLGAAVAARNVGVAAFVALLALALIVAGIMKARQ